MAAGHAEAWERYAKKDAEFYVLTHDVDFGTPAGMEYFFETGRRDAERILAESEPFRDGPQETALEIGCGVGRLTIPVGRRYARVRVVDVAPTMLRKTAENAAREGLHAVEGFLPDGAWDAEPADFAWSRWVMQHIPDFAVIDEYVRRIGGCLRPGGVAHLQFDTRPSSLGYRARNAMPDAVLPRTWRRGVRRIRRTPGELRALFAAAGLRVVREAGERTAEHVFVLKR